MGKQCLHRKGKGMHKNAKEVLPYCPVCHKECEEVYRDRETHDIIGCDVCVSCVDAWNAPECFEGAGT